MSPSTQLEGFLWPVNEFWVLVPISNGKEMSISKYVRECRVEVSKCFSGAMMSKVLHLRRLIVPLFIFQLRRGGVSIGYHACFGFQVLVLSCIVANNFYATSFESRALFVFLHYSSTSSLAIFLFLWLLGTGQSRKTPLRSGAELRRVQYINSAAIGSCRGHQQDLFSSCPFMDEPWRSSSVRPFPSHMRIGLALSAQLVLPTRFPLSLKVENGQWLPC